jgi:hypothetical protein
MSFLLLRMTNPNMRSDKTLASGRFLVVGKGGLDAFVEFLGVPEGSVLLEKIEELFQDRKGCRGGKLFRALNSVRTRRLFGAQKPLWPPRSPLLLAVNFYSGTFAVQDSSKGFDASWRQIFGQAAVPG